MRPACLERAAAGGRADHVAPCNGSIDGSRFFDSFENYREALVTVRDTWDGIPEFSYSAGSCAL